MNEAQTTEVIWEELKSSFTFSYILNFHLSLKRHAFFSLLFLNDTHSPLYIFLLNKMHTFISIYQNTLFLSIFQKTWIPYFSLQYHPQNTTCARTHNSITFPLHLTRPLITTEDAGTRYIWVTHKALRKRAKLTDTPTPAPPPTSRPPPLSRTSFMHCQT